MHTEHLNNVRLGWAFLGWMAAFGATSLILFVLIVLDVLNPESTGGGGWIALAVAVGFVIGGAIVGFMVALAPILHGILIGLMSLVVWALINAVVTMLWPDVTWTSLSGPLTVNVMLVQTIAAILGARFGYRYAVARP